MGFEFQTRTLFQEALYEPLGVTAAWSGFRSFETVLGVAHSAAADDFPIRLYMSQISHPSEETFSSTTRIFYRFRGGYSIKSHATPRFCMAKGPGTFSHS